jgi:hypothetical protein
MPPNGHRCSLYCDGAIHALPALMDPLDTATDVLAYLAGDIPLVEAQATVLRVQPAREADVEHWKATVDWERPPEAHHTQPWLVFVHLPDWPLAPT